MELEISIDDLAALNESLRDRIWRFSPGERVADVLDDAEVAFKRGESVTIRVIAPPELRERSS